MYNRKFNIKKDFTELNDLENIIFPLINNMEYKDALNDDEIKYKKDFLKNYVRIIFFNQWKT